MTFYEIFFKLPMSERRRIAEESGMSLAYILKQIYVRDRNPVFRFTNAVALDKASKGKLPFFKVAEQADQVDWGYVARRLRQEQRKGSLSKKQ